MGIVIISLIVLAIICGVCYYKSIYDRIKENEKIPEDDWYF